MAAILCASLAGCGLWKTPVRDVPQIAPEAYTNASAPTAPTVDWIADLDSPDGALQAAVAAALSASPSVVQLAAQRDQARAAWRIATSDRLPTADLNLRGSRSVVGRNQVAQAGQIFNLGLSVGWPADLWGQLSEAQRAAALRSAAAERRFEGARRQLAADVARAWFNAIEARNLMTVFERRLDSLQSTTDIIESGYRRGLNEALDLYLARNTLAQERSNLEAQRQQVQETAAELQRLGGRYPDGGALVEGRLPELDAGVPAGLPSELLVRRTDIAEAWLNVLAADADVAVAQRARLPSLSLSGSAGRVSEQLANIISEGDESWSLVANLAGPLIDAGRRRAQVVQARASAAESEAIFVQRLLQAFSDVESALSRSTQLARQRAALVDARDAAQRALELATDQYSRGLVDFTTVLESQRRAYDATTQVVRLTNRQLQNRITLHRALGGEFALAKSPPATGAGESGGQAR
ncbi:MAG: TolC family protein [Pseudomonadota bacterium]